MVYNCAHSSLRRQQPIVCLQFALDVKSESISNGILLKSTDLDNGNIMHVSIYSLLVGVLLLMTAPAPVSAADEGERKVLHYYELKPSVVANVKNGAQYMRADIQLMTRDAQHLQEIEHHAPALRHELFLLISDQEGSALKGLQGKETFRQDALKALQQVMLQLAGNEMVEDLYFTSFFVQ